MKTIILITALLLSATSYAQSVYQCKDAKNKTIFTDQPCKGEGKKIQVINHNSGGSIGTNSEGKKYQFKAGVPTASRSDHSNSSPCKFINSTKLRRLNIQKKIQIGMDSRGVRGSWGAPSKINRSSHGSDQWVYYGETRTNYVYLKDGCVTSWN